MIGLVIPTGELIGPPRLASLKADGCEGIRLKADHLPALPPSYVAALAQEVLDAGMQPYVSIRVAEQMEALPSNAIVGLGNEPNLSINQWTKTSYRREADRCVFIAERLHRRIYLGGVSNTTREAFDWLEDVWNRRWKDSPHVAADIHDYPDPSRPFGPHKGFASWSAVVARWQQIVGLVPLLIGECGFNCLDFTEAQQAQYLVARKRLWLQYCDWFFAYELGDGPDPHSHNVLDHYGFLRSDGTKKPVYDTFFDSE